MKSIRLAPAALSAALVAGLMAAAPGAQAVIPTVRCDAPAATSALTTGGTQQSVQAAGSCTTSALALASTNGLVLSAYTYDGSGGANTYTLGSDTFVRFYTTGLMETGPAGSGQTTFAAPFSGSMGPGVNTVNASGIFTNYTNNLYSAAGLYRSLDPSLVAAAVNNSNAVAGISYASATSEPLYLAPGATTGVNLDTVGLGGVATSINNTGQVAGALYAADGSTRAFYTGANGSVTHLLGTGPGIGSFANVIADNGQVGGYVQLASGQDQAFLTTARGGTLVGLGAGSAGDSTQTLFANSLGQAIVDDLTTQSYYLYSTGTLVPVDSLFSGGLPSGYIVAGLDNAGRILIQDPELISLDLTTLVPQNLEQLIGAQSLTSTQAYSDFVLAQDGATPDASFFAAPVAPAGGSVPEPAALSLAGLGLALMRGMRRRGAARAT